MGESTNEYSKKQFSSANAVCEDCGQQWTATMAEVPVTIFIKDLDEYYKKMDNGLIEAVYPPMVLCVFRPSDREIWDTEVTLSCIAPHQESPYNWRISHKPNGPAAPSGCQIIPMRYNSESNKMGSSNAQQEMVTIKEEIKEEDEVIQDMIIDPLDVEKDIKPDLDTIAVSGKQRTVPWQCHSTCETELINLRITPDKCTKMECCIGVPKHKKCKPCRAAWFRNYRRKKAEMNDKPHRRSMYFNIFCVDCKDKSISKLCKECGRKYKRTTVAKFRNESKEKTFRAQKSE